VPEGREFGNRMAFALGGGDLTSGKKKTSQPRPERYEGRAGPGHVGGTKPRHETSQYQKKKHRIGGRVGRDSGGKKEQKKRTRYLIGAGASRPKAGETSRRGEVHGKQGKKRGKSRPQRKGLCTEEGGGGKKTHLVLRGRGSALGGKGKRIISKKEEKWGSAARGEMGLR